MGMAGVDLLIFAGAADDSPDQAGIDLDRPSGTPTDSTTFFAFAEVQKMFIDHQRHLGSIFVHFLRNELLQLNDRDEASAAAVLR
jgi:hypothetical protein